MAFFRNALVVAIAAALIAPSTAEASDTFTGEDWMRARLAGLVRENRKIDEIERSLLKYFEDSDLDGGGVTAADHDLADRVKLAKDRAREVSRSLERDLDGDGNITRQEIEVLVAPEARKLIVVRGVRITPTAEQVREIMVQLMEKALADDANRDGVISFSELQEAATNRLKKRNLFYANYTRVPMLLDTDRDGIVTLKEYEAVMKSILRGVDSDNNGIVSAFEAGDFRVRASAAQRAEREERRREQEAQRMSDLIGRCGFPKAQKGQEMHLVGAYTAKGIANVDIGGSDIDVGAAQVVIEAGDEPLYVVLTSYDAVVWKFTGALHRVQNVVVQSIKGSGTKVSRSGVVGIDRARVHFSPDPGCLRYFSTSVGSQAVSAAGRLRVLSGGGVAKLAGTYGLSRVSLPGGKIESSMLMDGAQVADGKGAGAVLWQALRQYSPGGLVSLKPEDVVAAVTVKRAEVLPHIAGIAQLVDAGALQPIAAVQAFDLSGRAQKSGGAKSDHPREFRIVKKIRYPAGLTGAHGIKFLLKRGVPAPEGDPGFACVLSEETGQRIAGNGRC
ncbi:MAG: hypothetical protein RLZ98_621 [Pseudomonadota bacterium]|jgi:hypothetical protein